jgi:hypothetical protein
VQYFADVCCQLVAEDSDKVNFFCGLLDDVVYVDIKL